MKKETSEFLKDLRLVLEKHNTIITFEFDRFYNSKIEVSKNKYHSDEVTHEFNEYSIDKDFFDKYVNKA